MVKGSDGKMYTVYKAIVYLDTTLEEFKDGLTHNKKTKEFYAGITAHNKKGKEAKKKAEEEGKGSHFGTNNDTPPGTYLVSKSVGSKGKRLDWLEFHDPGKGKGVVMVDGLMRVGMSIHNMTPDHSQGCVTFEKFDELKKALRSDLKKKKPIHMIVPNIYLPRSRKLGLAMDFDELMDNVGY